MALSLQKLFSIKKISFIFNLKFDTIIFMIKVPDYITCFAKLCKKRAKIYIVGGYIRDSLLKTPSIDIDLCGSLQVEQLQQVLENSKFKILNQNKAFGTAKIEYDGNVFEYTTFRFDTYSNSGRHTPLKVEFVETLEEDVKRRDFTINSIYYDVLEQKLVDPVGGVLDLSNKIIKTVLEPAQTLSADGERLLRMIKLKLNHNFTIDAKTFESAKKFKENLNDISPKALEKFLNYLNTLPKDKLIIAKELLIKLNANTIIEKLN